jgi:hypothetical protein
VKGGPFIKLQPHEKQVYYMKNRYIQMRNQKIIDWNFLYDYVVSKGFNLGVEAFNV